MKPGIGTRWFVSAALLTMVAGGLVASENDTIRTKLTGLEETTATINTKASGEFKATISEDGTMIKYEETYRDLSSAVTQSHIHYGEPKLTGQIVLYLCTNLTPPTGVPLPQACPLASPATITGTLTEADVIASPVSGGQGIDSGAAGFAEMVHAIKTGSAYVNVHSVNHPSGEIRGRLGHERPDRDDHNDNHGGHDH